MVYPANEETFDERVSPGFVRDDHLNLVQAFLKRLQGFLGYGGRLHDKTGLVMPVGSIIAFGGETAPDGWLLCDGKRYNWTVTEYVDLFNVIGMNYGRETPGFFNVPDLRGYFIRGYSKIPTISFVPGDVFISSNAISLDGQKFNRTGFPVRFTTDDTLPPPLAINTTYYIHWHSSDSYGFCATRADALNGVRIDLTNIGSGTSYCHPYVEEDKDNRLKLTCDGNDGEDLGSYQDSAFLAHVHQTNVNIHNTVGWLDVNSAYFGKGGNYGSGKTYAEGAVESRPRNVNVNYIIKR